MRAGGGRSAELRLGANQSSDGQAEQELGAPPNDSQNSCFQQVTMAVQAIELRDKSMKQLLKP